MMKRCMCMCMCMWVYVSVVRKNCLQCKKGDEEVYVYVYVSVVG